jgi:RNA polymerase sigma-70 factor (ECF subfamily)
VFCPESERWKELVRRIQAGDAASEDEFARIFYPRIMALASCHLRDLETAREITQETLLGVLQALREGRLREGEKLSAFVIGTARNLLNSYFQKRVQNPYALSLDPDEDSISARDQAIRESGEEEEEKKAIVGAALKKLKPIDRKILFLTLSEGLNPREIAVELGMKPENIRIRKSRALRAIQQKVKKMI